MDRADAPPALERAPGARAASHLLRGGCAEDRLSARLSYTKNSTASPCHSPHDGHPIPTLIRAAGVRAPAGCGGTASRPCASAAAWH